MLFALEDEILRGIDYFESLGLTGLLTIFWHFFFIDLPRYLCADIYVLFHSMTIKNKFHSFSTHSKSAHPLITVIVPTFNREQTIERTIHSLQNQTINNFEIIISDDGSTDRTVDIVTPYANKNQLTLIKNEYRGGKASALNHALKYAKGDWIVQIDSDSSFDRDALAKICAPLEDDEIGAVSGNIRVRNSNTNLITELQNIEYLRSISIGRRFKSQFHILSIVSGAFGAFKKELLDHVKGWELGPGDDSDITIKTRKMNKRIHFAHDAICMTDVPETIQSLIKQRMRWNRSLVRNRLRKHADVFNPFQDNFSLITVIAFVDQIYYQIIRGYSYVFYLTWIMIVMPELVFPIFFANFLLYTIMGLFETMIVWLLSERKNDDLKVFFYVPLFTFYKGFFLRMIRLTAYLDEMIRKTSYKDSFVPKRVGASQIQW